MKIEVKKLSKDELNKKKVFSWPIWEKEVSEFDWYYDKTEECYFLEGKVEVKTQDGKIVKFGKGDFVTFEKGLSCTWKVIKPVRKHYNFR
ncbi:MAG: cupin domain-containing protein [Candidatus Omnitrophica bacterium]|nr:cupin domain-containing protein [Candidatus Omnitrophota bacterium]